MKQLLTSLIILIVAATLQSCGYNTMVQKEEAIKAQWSQVEAAYQRRNDLLPMLVKNAKAGLTLEKQAVEDVIDKRAKATSIQIDAGNLSPEKVSQFFKAQDALSSAVSRLLVTMEKYPEFKTSENFVALANQIEGTENRIRFERKKFIDAVQDYNTYIRKFPANIMASIFGFEKYEYYQAQEGSEKVPELDYGVE
ncbi:MAG: LemA family protein [Bacteroidetes bacterium]|nr:MAG: LemA family protein [Bacteroidota bacterium]